MSGIVGMVRFDDAVPDQARAGRMLRAVAHRGPEGEHLTVHGRCVMGLARLSILDRASGERAMHLPGDPDSAPTLPESEPVSVRGGRAVHDVREAAQPQTGTLGSLHLVFNGEIYNHRYLRSILQRRGHTFQSDHSDAEVLLVGYREWGEALPKHLQGMFAFAIWDEGGEGGEGGEGYVIGVMTLEVEGRDSERFQARVAGAVREFEREVLGALGVRVELLSFEGPHLTPRAGAYSPLDFLRIGMTEKLERGVHFLLMVTEVDLAATTFSYTLALPSQLTNVGVVSTKRLGPEFWGREEDEPRATGDLTTLLLHTFGHLLNLPHEEDAGNVMYGFAGVDELAGMTRLTDEQRARMRRALPREAHERVSGGGWWSRFRFAVETLWRDRGSILRAVVRANPLRLLTRLPTMITAALSVIIVMFFSGEVWDVGSTVELYQLAAFSAVAVATATVVLYQAFAFGAVLGRGRRLAESTVVTAGATVLCLLLTMLLLFALFVGLTYLGTVTIFPRKLMVTWPTVDPAVRTLDHVKLSLFVAGLGVLAGSLGGRADSRDLVRGVLFLDEET